jgi:hypothetical protein
MPITATCPSCSQLCQVEDQYAGMMVRCPKCGNIIQVADKASPSPPPAPAAPASAPATPAPSSGAAGLGFLETVRQSAAIFGLDGLALKLVYGGAGCLAAMVMFTLFPWFSYATPSGGALGSIGYGSILGISLAPGQINFLLSAAALAFLVVTFVVLKKNETFDMCLWVVGGWSALAALWRLSELVRFGSLAGVGLYVEILASLGAAGTFGFIIFQRFIKKKAKN